MAILSNDRLKKPGLIKGLDVLVAYLLIIFFTLLFLTYLIHKISTFFAYDLPLKTLFLCAFFAFILGMLIPRIVSYGSNIAMMMALLSLFVLSSYVLFRSTSVATEKTTDTTSMLTDGIESATEEKPPGTIADVREVASSQEPEDLSTVASCEADEADKAQETPVPAIGEINETIDEAPEIVDEVASSIEPDDLSTVASGEADKADKAQDTPVPVIDEGEEPIEEKNLLLNIGIDDITTSTDPNQQLCTGEGGGIERNIVNESENHDIAYYLDLGFTARESGDYGVATTFFLKAIDIEPDNSAVLYIVIEICALLKLQGLYDDAIKQMQKGHDLALAFNDERMAGEFIAAIAYLRILRNILVTKHLECTPYPALPEDVKLEIDEEFRQWKAQSSSII